MTQYRFKLAGVSNTDLNSIKSMLRLSRDKLNANWKLVESGDVDLVVYALDSDAGKLAWENRSDTLTGLISTSDKVDTQVDTLFIKPFRKSSFSASLNLISDKIEAYHQHVEDNKAENEDKEKSTSWLGRLFSKKSSRSQLPTLSFAKFDNSVNKKETITDIKLLQSWIAQLPEESNQRISTLLVHLTKLNQINLPAETHFELLEVYRDDIKSVLFKRDISAVKRDIYYSPETLKAIRNISEVLLEIVQGYKKIIHHYYENDITPKTEALMFLCINRVTEQTALNILHAFSHYRVVYKPLWYQLHELYIYLEALELLHEPVVMNDEIVSDSFYQLYIQIILVALAEPYSLAKFEVQRLFNLIKPYVDEVAIYKPTQKEITSESSFMLTGIYCIDCSGTSAPIPMDKTSDTIRNESLARSLNIQPLILKLAETRKALEKKEPAALDIEQKLMLRVIPQLNTTYVRKYHRIKTGDNRVFSLLSGVKSIHLTLSGESISGTEWRMSNQSSGGIMAHRQTDGATLLNIGDIVGVFEGSLPVKMGFVKWIQIDTDKETFIGIDFISGVPQPAVCIPDGKTHEYHTLIIPAEKKQESPHIYSEAGLYSQNRKIEVRELEQEPYIIHAQHLTSNTLDYELFSYKIAPRKKT